MPGSRVRAAVAAAAFAILVPAVVSAAGVVVAPATRIPFPLTVEAIGTAGANESVEIRPKISATVERIAFTEGQIVAAGEVLVELDDAEALAAVAAAKASLVDAESRFRRAQELFRSELTSASDLETLEARRDASRAALDAAEARLAETIVRAPFAGRLGLRRVSAGALVGPSIVITTLDDTDPIKLDFDVPETALGRLAADLPIEARSAAWPDTTFDGSVTTIDTRVDPVSRTVTVRARVENPRGLLRPGMFLTVRLLRRDVTALVVPEQAIVPERSEQFVFVVGGEEVVEKRRVSTGRRRPGQVEVLEGLTEGELVIAEGTQKARDGEKVEIVGRLDMSALPSPSAGISW
jgi:membrane fusion protein (multidrug efflux system)